MPNESSQDCARQLEYDSKVILGNIFNRSSEKPESNDKISRFVLLILFPSRLKSIPFPEQLPLIFTLLPSQALFIEIFAYLGRETRQQ